LLFSLYSLSVERIFKMDSNNEAKPTAVVKPFSVNKQQVCSNCDRRAFIRGMMGYCQLCERVYRSMHMNRPTTTTRTLQSPPQSPQPVVEPNDVFIQEGQQNLPQRPLQSLPPQSPQPVVEPNDVFIQEGQQSLPQSPLQSLPPQSPQPVFEPNEVFSQEGQRWMTSTPISVGSSTPSSIRSRSPRLDVSDIGVPYTTSDEEYMDGFEEDDDDPDPSSYILRELGLDFLC